MADRETQRAERDRKARASARVTSPVASRPERATSRASDELGLAAGATPDQIARLDDVVTRVHAFIAPAGPSGAGGPVVQRRAGADAPQGARVRAAAAHGVTGSDRGLPHAARIQAAFGRHDVGSIRAHVGGAAKTASDAIGAEAYASGDQVAFARAPDLHTAAHEAAHVVQQRGGVQVSGGVGRVGDRYERHADAVANAVVQGQSAQPLLDEMTGSGAAATRSVGSVTQRVASGNGAALAQATVTTVVGKVRGDMVAHKFPPMAFVLNRVEASLTGLLVRQHPDDAQLRASLVRFVDEFLRWPRVAQEGPRGRYTALADALEQISNEFSMQQGMTCALEVVASLYKKTQPSAIVDAMTREVGNVHPTHYAELPSAAMAKLIGVSLQEINKSGLSPDQISRALRIGKIPNEHKSFGLRQQAVSMAGLMPMISSHVAAGGLVLLFVVKGKTSLAPAHEIMALYYAGQQCLYNPSSKGLDALSALKDVAKEYPLVQSYQKVSWQYNPFKGHGAQPGVSMRTR